MKRLRAVLGSIDFQEAFDFVHTGKMMKILEAHDVPPNLLQVNETMYMGTRAKVKMSDGISKEFHIETGVLLETPSLPSFFQFSSVYCHFHHTPSAYTGYHSPRIIMLDQQAVHVKNRNRIKEAFNAQKKT